MPKEQYIVGLDVGTDTIRVVQGKIEETGRINIIGAASVPANGLRKGVIVDIDEAVSSISAVLEKVERMTGVPVAHALLSLAIHLFCAADLDVGEKARLVIQHERPDDIRRD